MDTYEGLTSQLKSYIEKRYYDEIYTITDVNIWSEIYLDGGFGGTIGKSEFIPEMLREWKIYWNNKYKDIREKVGETDHLDEIKQQSWQQFQVFMECYNDADDIIKLAYEICEDCLYPIAVITMMQIFDAEACYSEYCELEFDGNRDWESIELNEEDDNSPTFFVRKYEF